MCLFGFSPSICLFFLLLSLQLNYVLFCFLLLIISHILHDHSLLLISCLFLECYYRFLLFIDILFSSCLFFVDLFILSFFFVINFLCVSFVVWLPHFLSFVPHSTFRFRLHVLTWVSQVKRFVECNNTQWTLQR